MSVPAERLPYLDLIVSYLTLRKVIGFVGLLMPIVVHVGGKLIDGIPLGNSISAYYYTHMRDEFVATLVVVGILLACYRTPSPLDNWLSPIAGIAAVGIAFFPMPQDVACRTFGIPVRDCQLPMMPGESFHFYFVAIFFALVFYMVCFRFTKRFPGQPVQRKHSRNIVYRVCGLVMFCSFVTIGGMHLSHSDASIFWPESAAVMAFAIAWLVKGQIVLKG